MCMLVAPKMSVHRGKSETKLVASPLVHLEKGGSVGPPAGQRRDVLLKEVQSILLDSKGLWRCSESLL
jgi:hypothetical protein